ncbi:MAG: arginine--tRNA ligase, partial [Planctomycetota bacterium]
MHLPSLLKARFADALKAADYSITEEQIDTFAGLIRGAGNPKFGDYQSNCAMPLGKLLEGVNSREVATRLAELVDLTGLCETPEVAGGGFINLKLSDKFLEESVAALLKDEERLLVDVVEEAKTIVIDYSSPNVAKPMHVGHIRTTVIGHCLAKTLRFLGHRVITDNHLGDWGTQFGMIIYGYKHFGDPEAVRANPVPELATLYRFVHKLMGYHEAVGNRETLEAEIGRLTELHAAASREAEAAEGKDAKKKRKAADSLAKKVKATEDQLKGAREKIAAVEADTETLAKANAHPDIATSVLTETAKLHAGDEENLSLWREFLPFCKDEINRVYSRLKVSFDHTFGESFYHSMLSGVVEDLQERGMATESDGAICIFLDDFDAPMIIRKRDGAFLYATTDLATLRYRKNNFDPDEILYVVDTRQGEHFKKLFAVAEKIGLADMKLVHVNFGTVLDKDGRPIKTRSGTLIGLEGLLNDAVAAAHAVVCNPDRLKTFEPPMDEEEQRLVSETVGIAAIKFADLGHDRQSDYRFDLSKMVALQGKTATYAQYCFARCKSILRKNDVTEEDVVSRVERDGIRFTQPEERKLALSLIQFEEALREVYSDYGPNHLVDYVYRTAEDFSRFNNECHVLKAETEAIRTTRLALVVSTLRVVRHALDLL